MEIIVGLLVLSLPACAWLVYVAVTLRGERDNAHRRIKALEHSDKVNRASFEELDGHCTDWRKRAEAAEALLESKKPLTAYIRKRKNGTYQFVVFGSDGKVALSSRFYRTTSELRNDVAEDFKGNITIGD